MARSASRDLGGGDRRLDVIDQRIGKAETSGEQVEIATLGPAVGFDGDARRRVELDFLAFARRRADDRVEIDGVGKLV